MPNCNGCLWFRSRRRLTEVLNTGNSPELRRAQEMAAGRDQEQVAADAAAKDTRYNDQGLDTWGRRPTLAAYCGLSESTGVYHIAEAKNQDGGCRDFADGAVLPRRSCTGCQWQQRATGHEQRGQDLLDVVNDVGAVSNSLIFESIDTVVGGGLVGEAVEVMEAAHNGGHLSNQPRYFDWCRRYSEPGWFALCRWENHDGRCRGWSS